MQSLRPWLFRSCLLFGALGLLAFVLSSRSPRAIPTVSAQTSSLTCSAAGALTKNVVAPSAIDGTCAQIPYAPARGKSFEGGLAANQQTADMYSWLTFVALNWPANSSTCAPDTTKSILTAPNNPTWLTYLSPGSIFKASGKPDAFCPGGLLQGTAAAVQARTANLPLAVRKIAQAHPEVTLYLSHSSKSAEVLTSSPVLLQSAPSKLKEILQSTDLPIVDQNGRFARYSAFVNREEYNYINTNTLYTKAGQAAVATINFPMSDPTSKNLGAMELKAAWKVLGPGDNPAHFFTQKAIVYNDQSGQPSPGPNPVTVGLIGLHILHKAQGQTSWAWSTFEQLDNDTTSFFNPHCKPPAAHPTFCTANTSTASATAEELGPDGKPLQFPTQIQPKSYIVPTNTQYNAAFQKLLAKTPWGFYRLVSTQWSSGAVGIVPQYMASTVQETFVPQNQSSGQALDGCASCHAFAKAAGGKKSADFSFLLGNAKQ